MKYYHIIYNSSQRSQSGSPGLGVRTYTEGTPKEYIELIENNGCFSYNSGSIIQPTAQALLENGNLILDMPATYGFLKLRVLSTNKYIYVYLRTVCVGFDYPYYEKFAGARTNNFVTDAYVFEEYPGAEFFQIFYEEPAEGSVSFIPKTPVPSPENEEMKALSLGQMALLPPEERPFTCTSLPVLEDKVVEMLLGYFEANRRKVPLLVICDFTQAARLMADLVRILPIQLQQNATFMTNYQLEGVKSGYKVFFINEGYRFDYQSTGQFQVLDLARGKEVTTTEAVLYREAIKMYLAKSDKASLDKLSSWLLSPLYNDIRKNSPEVKEIMYDYTIEPSRFSLDSLLKNPDELWPVMISYLKKDEKNQTLLDATLENALVSEQSPEEKAELMLFFNKLVDGGFSIESLAVKLKKKVSSLLLTSAEYLSSVLSITKGIEPIMPFIDKESFEEKSEYLDEVEMTSLWPDTFRLFYPSDSLDPLKIVIRMLTDDVETKDIEKVLASLGTSDIQICNIFSSALEKNQKDVERIWPIIEKSLCSIMSDNSRQNSLDEDTVERLSNYVITPLSIGSDMERWQNLMLLWSKGKTGSVNTTNASSLLQLAIEFKSPEYLKFVLDKALPYIDKKETFSLVQAVKAYLKDIKPEKLLSLYGKSKDKIDYIGTVKKIYDLKLKVIEQMAETDTEFLNEKEMEKVRVSIYGKKPSKPKKENTHPAKGKEEKSFFGRILGFFKR